MCLSATVFTLHEIIAAQSPLFRWVAVFDARLEPRGLKLGLLKFAFNAENFIRGLSWFIANHFVAIQC